MLPSLACNSTKAGAGQPNHCVGTENLSLENLLSYGHLAILKLSLSHFDFTMIVSIHCLAKEDDIRKKGLSCLSIECCTWPLSTKSLKSYALNTAEVPTMGSSLTQSSALTYEANQNRHCGLFESNVCPSCRRRMVSRALIHDNSFTKLVSALFRRTWKSDQHHSF